MTTRTMFNLGSLPLAGPAESPVGLGRGYVEALVATEGELVVAGWMLLQDDEIREFRWRTSSGQSGTAEVLARPDVGAVYPDAQASDRSGFLFRVESDAGVTLPVLEVTAVGATGSACRIVQPLAENLHELPTPPSVLMQRVAHTASADVFKTTGLKMFGDFVDAVNRHGCWSDINSMLDWGCGSGRTSMFFLLSPYADSFTGCDVDAAAIDWLTHHSVGGVFDVVAPMPPTPYESQTFDLVVSYSVLTHLDRETQSAWLEEIHRVMRPGGLFLASVHGEFAATWSGVNLETLAQAGILDSTLDQTLDGVTPDGYYRSTFQSERYTHALFSNRYEVLDIVRAGAGSFQDLVVARKPAEPPAV